MVVAAVISLALPRMIRMWNHLPLEAQNLYAYDQNDQ